MNQSNITYQYIPMPLTQKRFLEVSLFFLEMILSRTGSKNGFRDVHV
jgi:hypothetical protein